MPHQKTTYVFGPYQLDLSKRVLTHDDETISLTPKATELLILLVTNAGQLVEKEELLRQIWPNTFVEEANLSQNIFTLRRALGDDRIEPRYIETVAKRGYRFVAPVRVTNDHQHQSPTSRLESVSLSPRATGDDRPIIAVLPFINAEQNSELEFLISNLTDTVINDLSRLPRIHVMSHSSVARYKTEIVDPQQAGKELGAQAVLVGRITKQPLGMVIAVELVDTWTGWQLWGESFNYETKDLPDVRDAITRHLLAALGLSVIDDEEQRVTVRYTENAGAYNSYLEGRFHWSMYTRKSIETAIRHFQQAIERDPHYALAYAGIVDCYLRLATNYLPPADVLSNTGNLDSEVDTSNLCKESNARIRLRFEWDWKGVERELRRANELRTDYVSPLQWHVAYKAAERFYEEQCAVNLRRKRLSNSSLAFGLSSSSTQFEFLELTPNEEGQVYWAIAREQIDIGNYRAACTVIKRWWSFGIWPRFDGLSQLSCADLLLTAGTLAGCVASTKQLPTGQKHCEELLNGSIALFRQMGLRRGAAEGRIELALCYFRQGLFEVGRATLLRVLDELSDDCCELRSLALIRLAATERHAGRTRDALARLSEATRTAEFCGPWATGRCNLELASTYNDLAVTDGLVDNFQEATRLYSKALFEFQCIGNHRLSAIAENNLGVVKLGIGNFKEAQLHFVQARRTFDSFDDRIRCAQVDDSLAQLYCAQGRFDDADLAIQRAIQTMETGDEDAFLTEALMTRGLISCKLKKYRQAKTLLENAYRLAQRCGDMEGAGRALAILVEEMWSTIESEDRYDIARRIVEILTSAQTLSIHKRLENCLMIHVESNTEAS
jgi:DNA-binding winged helix-turn-helix (wHTH) protein/tetratricopeptide (TPR) repeat protein